MASADPEEGFRVTDRRRRTDDDEPPITAPPPTIGAPRAESSRQPASQGQRTKAAGQQRPERNLTGLFVMLASSAAMAMGDAPDPMTGQVHPDLAQAAELVDVLVLLREKTEGNRTPEETQILDEVLYDLQLRYVAATKRSGSPRGPARS
jgi:hypothetical protein